MTVYNSAEDEIERAIALSLQDQQQQQQKRQQQKREFIDLTNTNDRMDIDVSEEDATLNQAIMASLSETSILQQSVVSDDPKYKIREYNKPVGLKNVGNTCYVNSLLQTYFMIPDLRHAILTAITALPPTATTTATTATATTATATTTAAATSTAATAPTEESMDQSTADNNSTETTTADSAMDTSVTPTAAAVEAAAPVQMQLSIQQQQSIEFIVELQKLFAFLLKSNYKFIDPSPLLRKLIDKSGKPVQIGNQEDVTEFNDLFLERVEEGLNVTLQLAKHYELNRHFIEAPLEFQQLTEVRAKLSGNAITAKGLFYGRCEECINTLDANETPYVRNNQSEFSNLILPVTRQIDTLYDSLEELTNTTVDYTTDSGHRTTAQKTLWFTELPPVLICQLSRVEYDPKTQTNRKINLPLHFDTEIYLDRYLRENQSVTTNIRSHVARLKSQLHSVQQELSGYLSYNQQPIALNSALGAVAHYVNAIQQQNSLFPQMAEMLRQLTHSVDTRIKELQATEANLKREIKAAFDNFPNARKKYSLHSVLVHSGASGSGHYWAYLRNSMQQQQMSEQTANTSLPTANWLNFNDIHVTEVDQQRVLSDGIGGGGGGGGSSEANESAASTTSAYCLFYIDEERWSTLNAGGLLDDFIPPHLLKEIEAHNQQLEREIADFATKQQREKLQRYKATYDDRIQNTKRMAEESNSLERDWRIKSLPVMLASIGKDQLMRATLIKEIYQQNFTTPIHLDMHSETFLMLEDLIGANIMQVAAAISLVAAYGKSALTSGQIPQQHSSIASEFLQLLETHRLFRDNVHVVFKAAELTNASRFVEALAYYSHALERDTQLRNYEKLQYSKHIHAAIRETLLLAYYSGAHSIDRKEIDAALKLWNVVIRCAMKYNVREVVERISSDINSLETSLRASERNNNSPKSYTTLQLHILKSFCAKWPNIGHFKLYNPLALIEPLPSPADELFDDQYVRNFGQLVKNFRSELRVQQELYGHNNSSTASALPGNQ